MAISVQEARSLLTKAVVAVYNEMPKTSGFLRSFFKPVESTDRYVSIQVRRGTEKLAVDVKRGTNGNYNKVTKSTEKIISPPLYDEWFNATDLRLYDVAIGNATGSNLAALGREMADEAMLVRNKIERSYEKQAADILETGVLTLKDGSEIDFGRKATMIEDLSALPWSSNTVDPVAQIAAGCKKVRTIGKGQGGTMQMLLGESAVQALLNNEKFQAKANLRRVDIVDVKKQAKQENGGVYHGRITAGSWDVELWSYPEYYENANGDSLPYLNDKKMYIIPMNPDFEMGFGAVPQLIKGSNIDQRGAYLMQEFLNEEKASHSVHQKSAGVAIPTAVDTIYTALVLA